MENAELKATNTSETSHQEANKILSRTQEEIEKETEESLNEIDLKRKADEQVVQDGRKQKKRRLERVTGWGEGTSLEEGLETLEKTKPSRKRCKQSTIKEWVKEKETEGMSLQEMEMEMDWIDSSIIERM